MDVDEGSRTLYSSLKSALELKQPFLVGRFGTIEFEIIYYIENMVDNIPLDRRIVLERNAGVFPNSMYSVRCWALSAKNAMCSADVLAVGWFSNAKEEREILDAWNWNKIKIPLRSLEPYYVDEEIRYTQLFKGRRVCVVTSFTESAKSQVLKGDSKLWPSIGSMWDGVDLCWVQTGYAPSLALGRAGWEDCASWEEAVDKVVAEVLETKAEVVLIGCGGLGMIIGSHLKSAGLICIVMGGAIQVMFGIKGGRWERHPVISTFWNSSWVWPSVEETPMGAGNVEQACYWNS
jgi:hypothetical protein